MRSMLLRASRALFSQTPPQQNKVFKLPQRHQFHTEALWQTSQAIIRTQSCDILATLLRDNITSFTDWHMRQLYEHLQQYHLTIDNSFHQIIVPISLEYLKVYNREQALTMYQMLITMLDLKIDSPVLWKAVVQKLDNQNIYRYIPLPQTVILLGKLLENPQHSKLSLTRKLIAVVHQHKKYYLHKPANRSNFDNVLKKLEKYQTTQPQLTEQIKQLRS